MAITRSSLLFRLQEGADSGSWREFVRIYQPLIERTARRNGVPPCDVDDVVQDVLIQSLKSIGTIDKCRGRLRGWLRRVTLNKIHDVRRRRRAGPFLLADPETVPARDSDAEDWDREFRARLVTCALSHVRRAARPLTWNCFDEHVLRRRSAADVARDLSLSENAVYVNCSRVMTRLRDYCLQHGEGLADAAGLLPE